MQENKLNNTKKIQKSFTNTNNNNNSRPYKTIKLDVSSPKNNNNNNSIDSKPLQQPYFQGIKSCTNIQGVQGNKYFSQNTSNDLQ